jgi:hypothetical protein
MNIKKEQMLDGRVWINKYCSSLNLEGTSLNQVILFDQVRSCLLFAKHEVDVKLFWNYLNKNLCN